MNTGAAILLGAVFIISGVLKLRDPLWPAAAASLGAPPALVPIVGPAETILGVGLVVGLGLRVFAGFAVVLLALFTIGLVRAIRSGNPPSCACFGSISAKPIGPGTVVRNVLFMILGIIALA